MATRLALISNPITLTVLAKARAIGKPT